MWHTKQQTTTQFRHKVVHIYIHTYVCSIGLLIRWLVKNTLLPPNCLNIQLFFLSLAPFVYLFFFCCCCFIFIHHVKFSLRFALCRDLFRFFFLLYVVGFLVFNYRYKYIVVVISEVYAPQRKREIQREIQIVCYFWF